MTDLRAGVQQALEALENAVRYHGIMLMADPPQDAWKYHRVEDNAKQAITSLRNALEQPVQEPTPWRDMVVVSLVREGINKHKARELADHFAAEPAQEPVAWAVQACSKMWRGEFAEIDAKAEAKRIGGTCVAFALYTEPPQRPWVGLTDEEVQFYRKKYSKLFNAGYDKVTETNLIAEEFNSMGFYKEVSAALKERNT